MRRLPFAVLSALLAASPAFSDEVGPFTLEVGGLAEGARIPEEMVFDGFGCSGGNVSPEISWSRAPEGTQGFALVMYDPDAPTISGFWHWAVLDIPASATGLEKGAGGPESGALPEGARQGYTDFGPFAYGGPCPPEGHGLHRYQFTLHALSVAKLPEIAGTTGGLTGALIEGHSIGSARRTLIYSR
ncbi:YbhB/YbcL family Raf kinase inhibitor-like protein [Neomegalonema sp.]|uniref:YbhB/YbcL family Raf kinase inhibitor-like protein n=1 Tax=Neomegalonema sp. TaxID=2039713 RepID=UPI002618506B|nr:YbhB/YbcL family Raf kinase inhibitor-like protein [Neomegalonema sp.]MDD2870195.1 YbhB/YbcL family Raf kinase inhibitor-like protein [Neomegalonema sp.]